MIKKSSVLQLSNSVTCQKKYGFSLAEMLLSLLIVSVCLAATMPVFTQKKLTGGNGYWMTSNNSDIYYGLGSSRVSIGINKTPSTSARLTIAQQSGGSINTPMAMFVSSDGSTELGRLSFDNETSIGVGRGALMNSNGTGGENTAVGSQALMALQSGSENTAVGTNALGQGDGQGSTAVGDAALLYNTKDWSTAVGAVALNLNTTGEFNVALGAGALESNVTSSNNTAVGSWALQANNTGGTGSATDNTAVGTEALTNSTTGAYNTAVGSVALAASTTGDYNTANGAGALVTNTKGSYNTAIGAQSLYYNQDISANSGWNNTGVGFASLYANTTGSYNVGLGLNALAANKTGGWNIAIGPHAGPINSDTNRNNKLYIDLAQNGSSSFIYGDMTPGSKALTINGTLAVTGDLTTNVLNAGTLKTNAGGILQSSDIRLKNVKGSSNWGLDKIEQIQPKNFVYKKDKKKQVHTGVIAQELQKVFPNSVFKQSDGYLAISQDEMFYAMINSIKELNTKNEKLSAENKELKSQLKDINERLDKIENGTTSTKSHKKLGIFQRIWIFFFGE